MSEKQNHLLCYREDSALLIIDVQERIFDVMQNKENVLTNIIKLVKAFRLMDVPVYYTEQYPKGLGYTHPLVREELSGITAYQKMSFSCAGNIDLVDELEEKDYENIIVCGIESHVCVQQTVLDLLFAGFNVNLVADAISSRKMMDYDIAVKRMLDSGATLCSTESIIFELLQESGTPLFKEVSKLIK